MGASTIRSTIPLITTWFDEKKSTEHNAIKIGFTEEIVCQQNWSQNQGWHRAVFAKENVDLVPMPTAVEYSI